MINPFVTALICSLISVHIFGQVLNQIGRVYIPLDLDIGYPGAENVAIAIPMNKLFAADGYSLGLNVISFAIDNQNDQTADNIPDNNEANMLFEETIYFSSVFQDFGIVDNITVFDVTSVKYSPSKEFIIATVVPEDYAIKPGWLVFVNPNTLEIFHLMELNGCYLPDHIATANNGNIIIVSCEGESDDNTIEFPEYHPPGSVEIINISQPDMSEWSMINVGFTDFDIGGTKHHLLPKDVYLPYKNESFSINVEPEYGTCSSDNKYCYICLQEQNAIAILDMNRTEFVSIFTLGTSDYSVYGLDASDRDNITNIKTYPNLYGLRMPDAIDYFKSKQNRHYIFTANEGDSKDFDESRVGKLTLDATGSFNDIDIEELQQDNYLGRLKVTNLWGQTQQSNNIFEKLYAFSSRDFTVWEIINDDQDFKAQFVYSSNDQFEQVISETLGMDGFNCNDYVPSFDTRSDDKGPEPESVVTGTCNNGNSFAFIGMERVGGIFVYDITDIDNGNIRYVEYINNRNFSIAYDERAPQEAGDVGPEQIRFVDENIYGIPLLVVANADSSSVTMYRIDCGAIHSGVFDDDDDDKGLDSLTIIFIIIPNVLVAVIVAGLCVYWFKIRKNEPKRSVVDSTSKIEFSKVEED